MCEKILNSYRQVNRLDPDIMRQYWCWKYTENPLGESIGYAALDNKGEVASLRMLWKRPPINMLGNADIYQVGDTFTLPHYRRQGLAEKVLGELVKDTQSLSLYNFPNRNSSRIFDKFGWKHVNQLRLKLSFNLLGLSYKRVKPQEALDLLCDHFNADHDTLDWLLVQNNKKYTFWRSKEGVMVTKKQRGIKTVVYSTTNAVMGLKWTNTVSEKRETVLLPDILVYQRADYDLNITTLDVDYL